jgi:class 3 adenylate cyclase
MVQLSVTPDETSPSLAAIVAAVDPSLPEYRARTSPDGMMTIVFTDIEGSTELMERIGEERYFNVLLDHNRLVRACVAASDGEVVQSLGDGFMLLFASASAALACAVELQRVLAVYNERKLQERLLVRIGVHTGNVFQAQDDFLGKAVVLAARITGQARGGQILVSAACREYTERAGSWRYGETYELQLKGIATSEQASSLHWSAA